MSYHPDLYDIVTPASFRGDTEWYVAKARECGGPVLELGAGTGRITLAIADAGVAIHALDASEQMLDALRTKLTRAPAGVAARVTTVQADLRQFDLTERFALIIAPFRAFLHSVTPDDRRTCLASVRRHLRPGGRFACNVFHPSLEFMAQRSGALAGTWRWVGTYDRPGGGTILRSEATRYDTVRQVVHSLDRLEEYDDDGVLKRTSLNTLELAYLYPADIREMLGEAGFEHISISGGFDGRPFARDGDELVVEAW